MDELITVQNVRGRLLPNGSIELHLEDVARGLGFVQIKHGIEYVRWERVKQHLVEFGFSPLVGKGKVPEFIPENIVFKLCFKAENEIARRFQDQVTDEILPTIRKHGAYLTPQKLHEVLSDPDVMIGLLTDLKNERAKRERLEAKVEADKPKVLFADAVSASHNSILIRELAVILKQNGLEIGEKRLYEQLRNRGYLIKRQGTDRNMPTQRSMELGLFSVKETPIVHSDGRVTVGKTPKVTGKGQLYFINLFKRELASREVITQ